MTEMNTPPQNHLLAALPTEVYERLRPYLERVQLPLGTVLYAAGVPLRHIYFPVDCIVSMLHVMESGASAEIAMVGNEGFVGVTLLMGGDGTTGLAVVQSAGQAFRLTVTHLRRELELHGALQLMALRYTQ